MKKKIMTIALMLVSAVVFIPSEASAAERSTSTALNAGAPQIRVQIGGQRRRGRGWNRGRNRSWERRNNRTRLVRQVYYRNGRRYVRTVRVRY